MPVHRVEVMTRPEIGVGLVVDEEANLMAVEVEPSVSERGDIEVQSRDLPLLDRGRGADNVHVLTFAAHPMRRVGLHGGRLHEAVVLDHGRLGERARREAGGSNGKDERVDFHAKPPLCSCRVCQSISAFVLRQLEGVTMPSRCGQGVASIKTRRERPTSAEPGSSREGFF